MFEGVPLLLQDTEVRLETDALVVHSLESFFHRLHLEWREECIWS